MAISEMVRVTKAAEDSRDETKGIVIIHPVFKHKQLEVAMKIQGVDPETALLWYADPGKVAPEDRRNAMYPTLIIRKTPALSADKQQRIIDAVISSDALKSRHSVGEWVSRHVFGGYSNV